MPIYITFNNDHQLVEIQVHMRAGSNYIYIYINKYFRLFKDIGSYKEINMRSFHEIDTLLT